MSFYHRLAHVYPSRPINKERTFGYSVVSSTPISKNNHAVYGVPMGDIYDGRYSYWVHQKIDENTQKAIDRVLHYEHPQTKIIKSHESKQVENVHYLTKQLEKIKDRSTTGPKTDLGIFFVESDKLTRSSCDKFSKELEKLQIVDFSIKSEYAHVLCITVSAYVK